MAGELFMIIAMKTSLGAQLEFARKFSASPILLATMLVIFIIGMVVELHIKRGLTLD
jgi:NitT/TauT family transport system permease protein